MLQKILFLLLTFFPFCAFAAELPFTDVSPVASYYSDLKYMYDAGVIDDTPDHAFRPDGLLRRDEFVSIVVGVSCRKCLYPSAEDILRYTMNPFVDILKTNKFFYCISYAKEKEIIRGYTLDSTGKTQCQNGQDFSEVPFCGANNITRIEAAAVLLRQTGLWNETYNSASYDKNILLSDVDTYWYGYAQKAVEIGLMSLGADKKVFPNEYITRKEFVTMASKIFVINMCGIKNASANPADFGSLIKIFDKNKQNCSESQPVTTFPDSTETIYDFGWYEAGILTPPLIYNWTFINTNTNEQIVATGSCLDNFNLPSTGSWLVKLITSDTNGKSSTAYQQVTVKDTTTSISGISVQIGTSGSSVPLGTSLSWLQTSSPDIFGIVGVPLSFISTTTGGDGKYTYHWDFSDGGTASTGFPSHIFMQEGVYPVTLVVRDTSGNVGYAQLTAFISSNLDRDGDKVLDYDTSGKPLDLCPTVFGPLPNSGCPLVAEYTALGTVTNNLCLTNKIQNSGMIEGSVACVTCPCTYSSDFIAQVRSCDIIFPSITSPDKKTLYSRGGIFQVP